MKTRKQFENQALDRRARLHGPDLCRDSLSPIGQCTRSSAPEAHTISTICAKCGVTIQNATAERNADLCQPCAEGRKVQKRTTEPVPQPQCRSIDWQCIGIEKQRETDDDVTYRFVADIWEPNPEIQGRYRIAGQAEGLMRIIKATGEVLLEQPMPGDTKERRFNSAARKVKQHWANDEYPEKTMFACG